MTFYADLHIHSRYSRATARNLDFENIYHAARIKGISVVGTGDFTHPAWVREMESKLEPAEPGLFVLKKQIAAAIDDAIPQSCRNQVRFMLQAEISNIYKKDGKVRKNHNIIYFPDLASVKKFNARLDAIGNITSDGRPILGLDARDLLEIMLETSDQGFLVPAHIWTPWFSLFGSKSGFDRIDQCFGDLASHIFAVETGLSSDPSMNWRVADLDHVRLMSNSDAHSPGYLGRNACVFNTDLDYFAMRRSLETLDTAAYQGTLDMYPDQGKYHYDGHRKCGVSLDPDETARLDKICPACGRPLTLGVLHRVRELADRPQGFVPSDRQGYTSIIPLTDMLSEIFGVGPKTKKVAWYYEKAVQVLGPELDILLDRSCDDIHAAGIPLLAEAVSRMRNKHIHVEPGFDGQFGKIHVFTAKEKEQRKGELQLQMTLGGKPLEQVENTAPATKKQQGKKEEKNTKVLSRNTLPASGAAGTSKIRSVGTQGILEGLNEKQCQAVHSTSRAILITAGPGTGKTRTLTARIAHLISKDTVSPEQILALTFTNKAARSLSRRIQRFLPPKGPKVTAATFHGFCLAMLKEYDGCRARLLEGDHKKELVKTALKTCAKKQAGISRLAAQMDLDISLCKQQLLAPEDDLSCVAQDQALLKKVYAAYQQQLSTLDFMDFEDLIFRFYHLLTRSSTLLHQVQNRFTHVFVDEYQDLNKGQYELVNLLAENSRIFVIGDPDQSIYGFRGSDNRYFKQFASDYPGCEQIVLTQNYRSNQTILDASFQMISRSGKDKGVQKIFSEDTKARKLVIRETGSDTAEAVAVGKMIEAGVGGLSFFAMETRKQEDLMDGAYGFSDFAVLFRTRRQKDIFADVFQKHGIPFQAADKKSGLNLDGIRQLLSCFRYITGRWDAKDVQVLHTHFSRDIQTKNIPQTPEQILGPLAEQVRDRSSHDCLEIFVRFLGIQHSLAADPAAADMCAHLEHLARVFADPDDFMDHLALEQDPDHLADAVEKVSLLTMHAAKGLEFPVVFVTGCEQGLIPYARYKNTCENPAEERRLFYVAMTRAKDVLCLTYARKRQIFGVMENRQQSVFLDDIERRLALFEKQKKTLPPKKAQIQLELF
ncbi:MAG: UvrD-helicase domain-containing protein [Desulfotignum sp.]